MVPVEEGSAGEHLFPLVADKKPDVVVLDLNMPQFAAQDQAILDVGRRQASLEEVFLSLTGVERLNE